jgi:hypothetical protein
VQSGIGKSNGKDADLPGTDRAGVDDRGVAQEAQEGAFTVANMDAVAAVIEPSLAMAMLP